ncbi:MAG: GAF domain-containing protein [Chloroflexota bacterium]
MTLSLDSLQLLAWSVALVEMILGLYVLLLNAWNRANRYVSSFFLLSAASSLALGQMATAESVETARWATVLLAAVTPTIPPLLLLIAVVLVQPHWLAFGEGPAGWRGVKYLIYILTFSPLLLTLLDVILGSYLWYTGLDAATYRGGYATLSAFAAGSLARPIGLLNIYGASAATTLLLAFFAWQFRDSPRPARRLVWLLLAAQIVVGVVQLLFRDRLAGGLPTLFSNAVFVLAYGYAAFQQMVSERHTQRGRLQPRLTALILAVTVPVLLAVVLLVSNRASALIRQDAETHLATVNRALASNVSVWLDLNVQVLNQLASLPDVVSMEAERQKPLLELMVAAHPHMYLASTTDLNGLNVARSDDASPKDYSDRLWQVEARNGRPVTFQTLVGRTSGQPALVVSVPIRDAAGATIGVAMFASDLDDIAHEVQASRLGESGFAYVIDALDQAVAHPEPSYAAELRDLSDYPPIVALRQGQRGRVAFDDEQGQPWQAYVETLANGWGVMVQQSEAEVLADLAPLRRLSWAVIGGGTVLLLALAALTIRQAFRPIDSLTETATAIAAGDLTRTAPVESEDEIGLLAHAFNRMTERLRDLVAGLERRVAERTAELERQTAQLQAAAQVASMTASVLNPDKLIQQVVIYIRERFDLYHVAIFLLDPTGRWVDYCAGTGDEAALMKQQGLRLEIGGASPVGWCVAVAQPYIASGSSRKAPRLEHPLLPYNRSEAALPLMARGRVMGALDVMSERNGAFSEQDVTVLRIMADQIAIALDNSRLFAEVQQSLAEAQAVQRRYLHQAWAGKVFSQAANPTYRYLDGHIQVDPEAWLPAMTDAARQGRVVVAPDGDDGVTLSLPIVLRGQTIGLLGFKRRGNQGWSEADIALAQAVADQAALTLENLRLFDETRRRAEQEALVRELTEQMHRSSDVETILQTALQGLGKALGSSQAFVRLDVLPTDLD